MIGVLVGCVLGAALATVVVMRGPLRTFHAEIIGALEGLGMAVRGGQGDRLEQLEADVRELKDAVDRLPVKWEDVKRETRSLYGRATHHVRRALTELEERGLEDPELDELGEELGAVPDQHAHGGNGGRVPSMPTGVETAPANRPLTPQEQIAAMTARKWANG